jgi:hypothetical protein
MENTQQSEPKNEGKKFFPLLAPEEHAWIEEITGKKLSNEEAQMLIREATLNASWEAIYDKRRQS